MKKIGLYIHIPFCKSKCPYCDFYSMRSDKEGYDDYTMCILESMEKWAETCNAQADTVYIGGGTPSIIGADNISLIVKRAKSLFGADGEITVECNPSAIENDFFEKIHNVGVNRISLGMQSAVDNERKKLGRLSDSMTVSKRIYEARKAGIDNISLDVMLGVPDQTMDTLRRSAEFCIESGVPHVSAYMLKLEEGTYYYNNSSKYNLPDEDETADMYIAFGDMLQDSGYIGYEISNFAKPGFESKHNLKYWNCDEYIGIGPSAHSFLNGKRFYYPRDINAFKKGNDCIPDGCGGNSEEYIMLRLRLADGIVFDEYKNRYGKELPYAVIEKSRYFESYGLMKVSQKNICLTRQGFLLSNSIIASLENAMEN